MNICPFQPSMAVLLLIVGHSISTRTAVCATHDAQRLQGAGRTSLYRMLNKQWEAWVGATTNKDPDVSSPAHWAVRHRDSSTRERVDR